LPSSSRSAGAKPACEWLFSGASGEERGTRVSFEFGEGGGGERGTACVERARGRSEGGERRRRVFWAKCVGTR